MADGTLVPVGVSDGAYRREAERARRRALSDRVWGDAADPVVPEELRERRRRGLGVAIAVAACAALPIGVLYLGTPRGTFLFALALALLAVAAAVLRGWVDVLVVRPALLILAAPAVLAYTTWRILTLDSGNETADVITVLLIAFQGGVGLAAASYYVLETRRAAVIGLGSLLVLHLAAVSAQPAMLESVAGVGELSTSVVGALAVVAFIHLPSVNTDMLADVTRDAVEERDMRRRIQAMAAHDIRTPLSVATTAIETARLHADDLPPDRLRDVLSLVESGVRRAVALSDDLLSESLDAHPDDPPTAVRLADVVATAVAGSRIDADTVRVEGGDFTVVVPPRRVERILVNLLDNAAKHGDPPVVVTGEQDGDGWRLSVRDAGPGLGDDLSPDRLFDAGVRGVGSTSGQGLGLFIVQQFAASMGAAVRVEEPPDGGARFVVEVAA